MQKEGLTKQVKTQEADTEGLKSEVEALTQTVLILSNELNKVTQAHMGDRSPLTCEGRQKFELSDNLRPMTLNRLKTMILSRPVV